MRFTPGPWNAGPPADGLNPKRERYIHAGGEFIAKAMAGYIHFDDDGGKWWKIEPATLEANANLISAAPEMYEALKELIEWADEFCKTGKAPTFDSIWPARRALDKAEGKQP